jgi:hypothetical protein
MPKVVIDTSNVPDSDFEPYSGPIPEPGLYKAVLKKAWWTKSSNNKPMLKMIFELNTTNPEKKKYNGYPVWHNITNEKSTAWKMKELFAALGTGPKSGIDFDDQGVVSRIGIAKVGVTEVLINGKHDRYNGQDKLAINTLAPVPGHEWNEENAEESFDDGEATSYEESAAIAAKTAAAAESNGSVGGTASMSGEEFAGDSDEVPF